MEVNVVWSEVGKGGGLLAKATNRQVIVYIWFVYTRGYLRQKNLKANCRIFDYIYWDWYSFFPQ